MVEKLQPGSLQGSVTKSLKVSDFVLTEAAYDAGSRLPPHAHATIALQAGFVDQSHFSKVFKSYVGTTPAKYRRSFRRS